MSVRYFVACLLLVLGSVSPAWAGSVDEVRGLADQLDVATRTKDRAALERLIASDFVFVRGSGRVGDRADVVSTFTSPAMTVTDVKNEERKLIDLGDTVLVAAKVQLSGTEERKAFVENFRSVDVWAKRNGAWQVVYTQITMVPQPK
jgi:ketosteroid isomerase-like protein